MNLSLRWLLILMVLGCGLTACGPAVTPEPTRVPPPTAPSQVDSNILRLRVTEYAPASYRDANGQWTGLDVELARAMVEKAGFKLEFVELPFSRGLMELEDGTSQLMANLSQTPERAQFMAWIGPERTTKMGLVVKEGNEQWPIKTLDDLVTLCTEKKTNFGIQKDVFYSNEFNTRMQDPNFSRCFEYVADGELNPEKVLNARILGFFEETHNMRYQIASNPRYKGLALHAFILNSEEVYFGVSLKGVSPDKLAKLRAAFAALEKDGTLEAIRNREWK
jgi:polar amino acid transport system substrate-binding protein